MSNFKADCRKFQPNIFNKVKCSNCFRQRDEHSAEALESNRASRKVSKCGYLFVAPDWDFSNPLNRTKRWQRRWFVLYDDGELTYSVDDLPATIPQGVIDMNRVLEVSEAEDVTGNQFALAITSPDRATFVKGTCREESRWWRDVLSVFPRTHKQHGRHKRNATFPGIKASSNSLQKSRNALGRTPSPSLAPTFDPSSSQRVRFHSCTSESFNVGRPSSAPTLGGQEDVFPTKDPPILVGGTEPPTPAPIYHSTPMSSLTPSARLLNDEHKENTPPPYMQDYHDNPPTSESPPTQDKVLGHRPRTRRTAKREARGLAHPRSKSEVSLLTPFTPAPNNNLISQLPHGNNNPVGNLIPHSNPMPTPGVTNPLDDFSNWRYKRATRRNTVTSSPSYTSSLTSLPSSYVSPFVANPHLRPGGGTVHVWREDEGLEGTKHPRNRYSDFPSMKRFLTSNLIRSSGDLSHQLIISDLEESKRGEKLKDIADSLTRPRGNSISFISKDNDVKPTRESEVSSEQLKSPQFPLEDLTTDSSLSEQIRGDPDGCGLDGDSSGRFSASLDSSSHRVDLPAEEILYIKKGWLLKQGYSQDWSKHWFVLEGSGLKFYRDPSAEDNGILDGIIDLGLVKDVQEKEVGRNYGFVVTTWDDKKLVFSAVTCGIRSNWVQAMRNAANLLPPQVVQLTLGEKLEKEIVASKDSCDSSFASVEDERDAASPPSAAVDRLNMSSEEDFKTASESSFFKDVSKHDITNTTNHYDGHSSRATTRVMPLTQRSRSSPPSSRRCTKDDFPSNTVCLSEADSVHSSIPSMQDLDRHLTPERDSSGTLASTGEAMLLDLLEAQVESLKAKLEQTQASDLTIQNSGIEEKNEIIEKIEVIRKQLQEERKEWEGRLMIEEDKVRELKASEGKHAEIVRSLTRSLQEAELKAHSLTQDLNKFGNWNSLNKKNDVESSLRTENSGMRKQVVELTAEISRLQEALKSEKSEVYKWKDLVKELRSLLDGRNQDMEAKREEVLSLRDRLRQTQVELDATADRLHRGIEENEGLCGRLRELERTAQAQSKVRRGSSNLSISSSREKFTSKKSLPRMDSLSDLTNFDLNFNPEDLEKESLVEEYTDLRLRFEKAVGEIRALKKEVRGAESLQDDIELTNKRLRAELKTQEGDFRAQLQLMGTRVEDLTTKLNNSEKQVRSLKQKLTRTESRERRRTLSLKGKESFSLSKDLESKLTLLEEKVASLYLQGEQSHENESSQQSTLKEAKGSKSFEDAAKKSRLRRKSLEGTPTEEDALKAVVRVNALEERISAICGKELKKASSTSLSSCSTPEGKETTQLQSHTATSRSKSPLISPMRSPASPRKFSGSRTPKLPSDKTPKLTRSESEPRLLKEKVSSLERVLSTIQAKLSECQTCAKTLECACSCGGTSRSRLQELLSATAHVAQFRHSQCDQVAVKRVRPLALRLQDLLKEKMTQLVQRRQQLRAAGKWTRDAQLKGFAERLAFETTLLSQLAQAIQAAQNPKSFEASLRLQELIEAHRKLSFLEKKLLSSDFDMEPMTPLEFYSSLLAEKLVIEGDVLGVMTHPGSKGRPSPSNSLNETCKDLLTKVLERERSLAEIVTRYKEEKLYEIAVVMARETVTGTQPLHDDSVLLEELRLREAWGIAQDLLTQEIINLEASQSILRLSHLLVPVGSDIPCVAPQMSAASLDRLQTGAEDSLRQEMEESVFTLSAKYEEVLSKYRSGDTNIITSVSSSMEVVLGEFAAVIAQKALIDGQLAVATGDEGTAAAEPLTIVEEKVDPLECAGDVAASESHLLMFLGGGGDPLTEGLVTSALTQAEFAFIYNKVAANTSTEAAGIVMAPFSREPTGSQKSLNSSASDRDFDSELTSSLTPTGSAHKIPPPPKSRRRLDVPRKSRRASDITGMVESCRQCEELRQELTRLKRSLDGRRLKRTEAECKKCLEYLQALKLLEEDHRVALEALQSQHQGEISRLRDQVKYDPPTRDSDDELTELKRRLCLLEEGYEAQIAALKKQYQEALGSQSDVCEENIRQRYQLEIEHLRELCEKGLTAMESSHRRLVADMADKHRREMEALQAEKEEALAEETQATLAALDAMRKAHEAEVQREVAKFKEEFLRRAENGREGEAAHSRLHEEEIREVRREILQLSEKYSSKCLETAAKEQKVESLQRQLTEAKAQARSLEERNRLLKQRLNGHLNHLQTSGNKTVDELQNQHECELALKDEEIAWLNQMLQKSKMEAKIFLQKDPIIPASAKEEM